MTRNDADDLTVEDAGRDAQMLARFDRQVRRSTNPEPNMRFLALDEPAPMLLLLPDTESAWGGGVMWSEVTEATADDAIAAAVETFAATGSGKDWEWKYYAYDQPPDLPARLVAAGFERDDDEALVIGQVEVVCRRLAAASDPDGITIRAIRTDPAGSAADWRGMADLDLAVWGEDGTERAEALAQALAADPEGMAVWVAVDEAALAVTTVPTTDPASADSDERPTSDGLVVCAARVNFHHGTDFASLWGGSTLADYRGRGIYQAIVSRRADQAAERGYSYLQVDASPDSRPILERLGMRVVTTTTPYNKKA